MEKPHTPKHILFTLRHATGNGAIFVIACFIVGLMAGGSAFFLKRLTAAISRIVTDGLAPEALPWRFLWMPLVGIILAGCYQQYILHRSLDHGTDRINQALKSRQLYMPLSTMISPVIGASITLGMGGSAGSEGPIAYAGAAIGSNVGRWFRMSTTTMAALVAIGAGAGIAGVFKAPIGGFFFTIEVLLVSLSTISVIGLATGCITAGLVCYALSGFSPDIIFSDIPDFSTDFIIWAIPVGVISGLYSVYYSSVMNRLMKAYESIKRPWTKWIVSGTAISLLVFTLPSMFGEGYKVIAEILDGTGYDALSFGSILGRIPGLTPLSGLLLLTGAVVVVKAVAAASTNSGGGVAGDFAPTIFAGAVLGYLIAIISTMMLDFDVSRHAVVFMAMGGVMAGSVRAPFMAIFLVVEMTGAYNLFLPLVVSSVISYLIVRLVTLRSSSNAR